ncbi:retrovirus-related pol polyprotein from transposon TNT 1-94 [Tanacetum coccineum]
MILNSLQNDPLVWPTVEENGTTRTKKYKELSVAEQLQADCDLIATNIVLQGLLPDLYAIVNHHKSAKEIWDRVKLLIQGTKLSLQEKECLVVPMFNQGDDPIACLNKAMDFLTVVAFSNGRVIVQQVQGRQGQSYAGNSYKGNATSSGGNNAGGQAKVVKCYNYQGEGHMARQCTQPKRPKNAAWFKEKAMLVEAQEAGLILDEEQLAFLVDPGIPDRKAAQTTIPNTDAFQTEDLNAYDSDCDDVSNAKANLMANLSNYGSNVILKVPYFKLDHTDMDNQSVHAMQNKEIDLEKKIKELDNIVYKVGQSAETVLMLTKPHVFYNDTHKQALGYQNPFYLKKAQRIKPTLYDGSVISSQHIASHVFDDEETLILEEENIKSIRETEKEEKVNHGMDEIETIKIELEHRKETVENVAQIPIATTIAPGMFKLDIEPLSHRLKNNKDAHEDYLMKTIGTTDTICELVERAKKQNPSEPLSNSACKFTKHVQELLVYVSQTCPSFTKPSEKLVAVTPMNKVKKVRYSEPLISSSNIKQVESSKTPDSNTPVVTTVF